MDYYDDPDFDLLLDELSKEEVTSSEDFTLSSSSSDSMSSTSNCNSKKLRKSSSTDITDDSSMDSFHLVKPRMLRSDIRRSYGSMLLNVFNTADLPVMYGFFDTFSTPTMQNVFSRPDCANGDGRLILKQSGVNEVIQFWWTSFACKSDSVLTMKDCNVVTPLHSNGSQVVLSFNFKATILYDENQLPKEVTNREHAKSLFANSSLITVEEAEKLTGKKRNKHNELNEKNKAMKKIMNTVDQMLSRLSLRSQPLQIDSDGIVTMDLDDHKRITQLSMNCKPTLTRCGPDCQFKSSPQ